MMAPSESQNDLDALSKKIDAALTLPNERVVVDDATKKDNSDYDFCQEGLEYLEKMRVVVLEERKKNHNKFQSSTRCISSRLLSRDDIMKSHILYDHELLDAILYSQIFKNELEYAKNRDKCRGEMVWVPIALEVRAEKEIALICGNKIICTTENKTIDSVREEFKKHWEFFKDRVRKNLLEAFGAPVSMPEASELDSKSSTNAAVSSNAPRDHQELHTMTAETTKIVLDELASLNLDPGLKQQFEFDLKLFPGKDVCYWRHRLEGLRCFAHIAPVGSAQSEELVQLRQKVAELEKTTANLRDEVRSALNALEKVSKPEGVGSQNESGQSTSTDTLSKERTEAHRIMDLCNESLKLRFVPDAIIEGWIRCVRAGDNAEEFREMEGKISNWLETDEQPK